MELKETALIERQEQLEHNQDTIVVLEVRKTTEALHLEIVIVHTTVETRVLLTEAVVHIEEIHLAHQEVVLIEEALLLQDLPQQGVLVVVE